MGDNSKVLDLYTQMEALGMAARSMDEVDQASLRDGLLEVLEKVCEAAIEAQMAIHRIEDALWGDTSVEAMEATRSQLSQLEQDLQGIPPHEAAVLPSCADSLNLIANCQSRLAPCIRAAEASISNEHWGGFFRQAAPQMLMGDRAIKPAGDGFTVGHLMAATAKPEQMALLDELVARAKQEASITATLNDIAARFNKNTPPLAEGVPDEGFVQYLVSDMESMCLTIRNISATADSDAVAQRCEDLSSRVRDMQLVIQEWYELLTTCNQHQALFTHPLQRALPETAERLTGARQRAGAITDELKQCQYVAELQENEARWGDIREALLQGQELLQEVREVLLVEARAVCEACPRFNLLDEPLLLQCLAVRSDVENIRPYLSKLFASVSSLVLQTPTLAAGHPPPQGGANTGAVIRGVESVDGEHILFENPLKVDDSMNVGEWMAELSRRTTHALHRSVNHVSKHADGLRNGKAHLDLDFFERFPGQISVVGIYIAWTALIEGALGVPRTARPADAGDVNVIERLQVQQQQQQYERRPAAGSTAAAATADELDDLGIIDDDDDDDDWEGANAAGLGTITHNSVRPHSANPPVTAARPLSASSYRQGQPGGGGAKRPNTAENRLKNLTNPLSQESSLVRPGSAAARPKAQEAEKDHKPAVKETKAARKGSTKKKAKAEPTEKERRGDKIEQRLFEKRQLAAPVSRPHSATIRQSSGVFAEPSGQVVSQGVAVEFPAPAADTGEAGLGRSRWVTSLGFRDAIARLRQMQQSLVALTLTSLSRLRRVQVEAAIAHLTHLISIVTGGDFKKAESADDFQWQRHARIYRPRNPAGGYTLKIGTTSLEFGGELHTAHTKSVLTPHLAKTWLHLAQAVSLRYGAVASGEGVESCLHDLSAIAGKLMPTFRLLSGAAAAAGEEAAGQLRAFFIGVMSTGSWGMLPDVDRYSDLFLSALAGLTHSLYAAMESPTSLVSFSDINPHPRGSMLNGMAGAAATMQSAPADATLNTTKGSSASKFRSASLARSSLVGDSVASPREEPGPSFFPKPGAVMFATLSTPPRAPAGLWFPVDDSRRVSGGGNTPLMSAALRPAAAPAIPAELSLQYRAVTLPPVDFHTAAVAWLTMAGFAHIADTAAKLAGVMQALAGMHAMQAIPGAQAAIAPSVLKTVIAKAAACLRRASPQEKKNAPSQTLLILKALREVLLGAAPAAHHPLVEQAIADAFPGQHTHVHHLRVGELIQKNLTGDGLVPTPAWVAKITNLYELQMSSRALLLHGAPLTGKTSAFTTLRHVLGQVCGEAQPQHRLYPASHGAANFWGRVDESSQMWVPGVFAEVLTDLSTQQAGAASRMHAKHKPPPTGGAAAPKGTAAAAALPLPPPIWLVLDGTFDFGAALDGLLSGAEMTFAYPDLQMPIPLAHAHLRVAVETESLKDASPRTLALFPAACFEEAVLPWTTVLQAQEARGLVDKKMADLFRTYIPKVAAWLAGLSTKDISPCFGGADPYFLNLPHTVQTLTRFVGACREGGWVQGAAQDRAFWWGVTLLFGGVLKEDVRSGFHRDVIQPHIPADWVPSGETTLWGTVLDPLQGFVSAGTAGSLNVQYNDSESTFGKQEWKTRVLVPRCVGSAAVLLKLFHSQCKENVVVVGDAWTGKSLLCEEHLRRGYERPWVRYTYTGSHCDAARKVAEADTNGRCVFLDDVHLDAKGPVPETAAALYEILAHREDSSNIPPAAAVMSMRGGRGGVGNDAPPSLLARLASRFLPVYIPPFTQACVADAFTPLFAAVWQKANKGSLHGIRGHIAKLVTASVFGLAGHTSREVLNAKFLAEIMSRFATVPVACSDALTPGQFAALTVGELTTMCDVDDAQLTSVVWNDAVRQSKMPNAEEFTHAGDEIFTHRATLGQTFTLECQPNAKEFEEALQKTLEPGFVLCPTLVRKVAEVGKVVSLLGGNVLAVGPAGCGRHSLAKAAAKMLKFEYVDGLKYSEQLEKVVRNAAQGTHGVWIIPAAEAADPANARYLEQIVEGEVLNFLTAGAYGMPLPPPRGFTSGEPAAFLDELAYSFESDYLGKALEASKYKISVDIECEISKWAVLARHIALHLHVVICVDDETAVPRGVRAKSTSVRFPTRYTEDDTCVMTASLADAFGGIASIGAAAADTAAKVGRAVHALQARAQAAVVDARKDGFNGTATVPPCVYPGVVQQVKKTFARHSEHCMTRSGILVKQERPLVAVSSRLMECTGSAPRAILPEGVTSTYFDGVSATSRTHMRFAMVLETVTVERSQAAGSRRPSVNVEANTGGDEGAAQASSEMQKVTGVSHVGCYIGHPDAPEFFIQTALQPSLHYTFDAATEQLSINLPAGSRIKAKFIDSQEAGHMQMVGTAEHPSAEAEEFEVDAVPLQSTDEPMDWLRVERGGGERVEPKELLEEPPSEGLDSLTKKVHEAVEAERRRIAMRLRAISLGTLAGDAFVAAAHMTLAPLMPANAREGFYEAVKTVAADSGLELGKALTVRGMNGVWYGLDEMDPAGVLAGGRSTGVLVTPSSWDPVVLALCKAPHAALLEQGRLRPIFVYDPAACYASMLLHRDFSTQDGDAADNVTVNDAASLDGGAANASQPRDSNIVTITAESPALYGAFVNALTTGKTLVIEHVQAHHYALLRPYMSIYLDPGKGRATSILPGFLASTAYSDAFKLVFLSDSDTTAVHAGFMACCTYIDLSVSSASLGDWIAESIMAQDFEQASDIRRALTDLDTCEQKLFAAEHHLEMLSWDVDWDNALEWYYTPPVIEALASLQGHTQKSESALTKYESLLQARRDSLTEFAPQRSKVMMLYDSASDTAVLGRRWNGVYSPPIVAHMMVKLYIAAVSKGGGGARGRYELFNTIVGQMSTLFLRAVPPDDRLTFATLAVVRQEVAAGDLNDVHLRMFVSAAKGLSLDEHILYEQDCKSKIDQQYQADMRAYHEAQADLIKKRQAEEEKEGHDKAAKKGAKKGTKKKAEEMIAQPQRAALPMDVKPAYPWLTHAAWLQLMQLSGVPVFAKLQALMHNDPKDKSRQTREQRWLDWFNSLGPKIPEYEKAPLSRFEKMLLALTARPDKALQTLRKYIVENAKHLDPYASVTPLSNDVYNACASDIPVTFLIKDADANAECYQTLVAFAQAKRARLLDENCIAMQDGSEPVAFDTISRALASGDWVYLANVHCASSKFMRDVVGIMRECADLDSPFRLFMTYRDQPTGDGCAPAVRPTLVARSVLVSMAVSRGVKNSMTAVYRNVMDKTLESLRTLEWQRLLYVLMLVVALANERRQLMAASARDASAAPAAESCVLNAGCAVASLKRHFMALKMGDKHKDTRLMAQSWESLRFTVAEVLATGAAKEDELKLKGLLDWWLHPDVVKTGMKVCKGVTLPTDPQNLANHWALIDAIPAADFPELFGLHPSCEMHVVANQLNAIRAAVGQIVLPTLPPSVPSPKANDGMRRSPSFVGLARPVATFMKALPEPWSDEAMVSVAPVPGKPYSSYLLCLRQEMRHLQEGLAMVRSDINSGVGVAEVNDGVVPARWRGVASAHSIGAFVTGVRRSYDLLEAWRSKQRLPRPLHVGALAFPEALFTAQLQEAARSQRGTIAHCALACEVLPARRTPAPGYQQQPHEPLVLSGLATHGFRWDSTTGAMTELLCKQWWSDLSAKLPLVLVRVVTAPVAGAEEPVRPMIVAGARGRSAGGVRQSPQSPALPRALSPSRPASAAGGGDATECNVAIPVYHTASSPYPLVEIPLLSKAVEPNHWVLRNAHVVCRQDSE